MKVAFWSNTRGRSCVTSNLACTSVLSALSRPEERTILFENHQNIVNLGSTLFMQHSEHIVRQEMRYTVESGLGKVLSLIQKEDLSEERFFSMTKDYLGKRLFYIPAEDLDNAELLEYQLNIGCVRVMRYLEQYSDMVFVDTSASPLSSSRKILQQADMVVVNLSQNESMMSHFFRNYSSIQEKAFYLIGNYDEKSQWTKSRIVNRYGIPGRKIGIVPHNVEFSDAISNGRLIPFLLKNYDCGSQNQNYDFMAAAREAVELFRQELCALPGGGNLL